MAQLQPGLDFATNERITAAKLHQFVDDAFLTNVANDDLLATIRAIWRAAPGSPAAGDVRVGTDGRLEFYVGGVWTTQPDDVVKITLTNKSGSNLVLGDVVVPDPTNPDSFTISAVNRTPNVIGVLAADIANNASGLVAIRGKVSVRVAPTFGVAEAGELLLGPNGTSGTAAIKVAALVVSPSTSGRSDAFGQLLERASTTPTQLCTAYIWK